MAKAIKKVLAPVKQPYEVFLTLSKEEAQTLYTVLQRIGGIAASTRRKYSDQMLLALREAGVADEAKGNDVDQDYRSIWFI